VRVARVGWLRRHHVSDRRLPSRAPSAGGPDSGSREGLGVSSAGDFYPRKHSGATPTRFRLGPGSGSHWTMSESRSEQLMRLEGTVTVAGRELHVVSAHLKSKLLSSPEAGSRPATRTKSKVRRVCALPPGRRSSRHPHLRHRTPRNGANHRACSSCRGRRRPQRRNRRRHHATPARATSSQSLSGAPVSIAVAAS